MTNLSLQVQNSVFHMIIGETKIVQKKPKLASLLLNSKDQPSKVSSVTLHSNRGLHWWVRSLNFNWLFELDFNSLFQSLWQCYFKNEVCIVRNLQAGRYNPTTLHLNVVLSLTPSQEFILICFWYLENLKISFIILERFFWNSR